MLEPKGGTRATLRVSLYDPIMAAGRLTGFAALAALLAASAPYPVARAQDASPPAAVGAVLSERPIASLGEGRRPGFDCRCEALAFSPDGTRLAVGNQSTQTVEIHAVADGRILARTEEHDPYSLAWAPSGIQLLIGGFNKALLWEVGTSDPPRQLNVFNAGGAIVDRALVGYGSDGASFLTFCLDELRVWETGADEPRHTIEVPFECRNARAISPDGTRVLFDHASEGHRLFHVPTESWSHHLASDGWWTAFSPDGTRVAIGGEALVVWDAAAGTKVREFDLGGNHVTALAFVPKGDSLVVGTHTGEIAVWDIASGAKTRRLGAHSLSVRALAHSPRGDLLASAGGEGTVRLWSMPDGVERFAPAGHTAGVHALAFTADSTQVVTASADATIRRWDVAARAALHVRHIGSGYLGGIAMSADGRRLAAGCSTRERAGLILGFDGDDAEPCFRIPLTDRGPRGGVWLDGGQRLVVVCNHVSMGSPSARLVAWRVAGDGPTEAWSTVFGGHINDIQPMPDGTTLALAVSGDSPRMPSPGWSPRDGIPPIPDSVGIITLRRATDGSEIASFAGDRHDMTAVAVSSASAHLVGGDRSGALWFWNRDGGPKGERVEAHPGSVIGLRFLPGTSLVVSASSDGTLAIWDFPTRTRIRTRSPERGEIQSLALAPNGGTLATGHATGAVLLWEVTVR